MKRFTLLFVICGLCFSKLFSQCVEPTEKKVLLVGDSWAFFMNSEATINNVFKTWGHSNYKFVSNASLSISGAQTDDFMTPASEAEILNQLTLNPTINVVHLSIGGNDFLGDWNVSNTQGQTDTLFDNVFQRLDSIIRYIKSCKPGIHIVYSGYVYPNFAETIHDVAPFETQHPFYGTWDGMEKPTYIQINTILNQVCERMDSVANADPQLEFFKCPGLMQYLHGQTSPLTLQPPTGTYAAFTVPMPYGDPNFPSPKSTMRDYGIAKDCYHLSTQGYKDLVGYSTQKFYHKFLMDDLYLLSDHSAQTGTVSSTGNTDSSLYMGEASGEQFATVLSFNTTAMADTTLRKASLFLRRKSLSGTNPISGSIQVKIKSGNFGATADVEPADFTAVEDASGNPCLFGSNTGDGDWIRLDLPVSLFSHISHSATTQFIVSAPGATGGKVQFNNSADPELAPVLNLAYGQTPSAVNEINAAKEFYIYPNPTNGLLTIETGGENITHLELTNLLGQVVLQPAMVQNTVNVSTLAAGVYMLNITTKNGKTSQRVVKE